MEKFWLYLLGTQDYYQFCIGLFFLFLGIAVSLLLHVNTREIHSPRSPMHFSYRFLIGDNVKRLLLAVLLSVILFRFAGNIFMIQDNMYVAFLIGFSFDKIIQLFKDKFKVLK